MFSNIVSMWFTCSPAVAEVQNVAAAEVVSSTLLTIGFGFICSLVFLQNICKMIPNSRVFAIFREKGNFDDE